MSSSNFTGKALKSILTRRSCKSLKFRGRWRHLSIRRSVSGDGRICSMTDGISISLKILATDHILGVGSRVSKSHDAWPRLGRCAAPAIFIFRKFEGCLAHSCTLHAKNRGVRGGEIDESYFDTTTKRKMTHPPTTNIVGDRDDDEGGSSTLVGRGDS